MKSAGRICGDENDVLYNNSGEKERVQKSAQTHSIDFFFFFFLHQKGKPVLTGAVRVSFGSTSLPSDVDKVLQFL
jgi:hypothetical protein